MIINCSQVVFPVAVMSLAAQHRSVTKQVHVHVWTMYKGGFVISVLQDSLDYRMQLAKVNNFTGII